MPVSLQYRAFQYFKRIHGSDLVLCVKCPTSPPFVLRAFEEHVQVHHGVPGTLACVFCMGKVTWRYGAATSDEKVICHRLTCLKKLLNRQSSICMADPSKEVDVAPSANLTKEVDVIPSANPTKEVDLIPLADPLQEMNVAPSAGSLDLIPSAGHSTRQEFPLSLPIGTCCSEVLIQHMDGREVHPEWTMFYSPIGEDTPLHRNTGQRHVRFLEASGLGLEMYNVFDYFRTGEYQFYHIMVRAVLWDTFCQQDLRDVYFLPYWTCCDGDHKSWVEKVPERRHHRHTVIMMTEERHVSFQKMWLSLVVGTGEKNKVKKPIQSVTYLMNVLNYVSRPEDKRNRRSHYWIHRPFQRHARWAIAYLFQGGHEYLIENLNKNKHITSYFEKIRNEGTRSKPSYKVKIGYLNIDPVTCRMPFADGCVPCPIQEGEEGDNPLVYEWGERKALKYDPEQRVGYACWPSLTNRDYRLGKPQTKVMNQLHTLLSRKNREWSRELKLCQKEVKKWQVEAKNCELDTRFYQKENERYKTEVEELRTKNENFRTEKEKLQEMLRVKDMELANMKNQYLEERIRCLEERVRTLESENEKLRTENEKLRHLLLAAYAGARIELNL